MIYMRHNAVFGLLAAAALLVMLLSACAHVEGAPKPAAKPRVGSYEPYKAKPGKIRWMRWDAEAFEEARSKDKLIFLDVSASWCHWCMVMEETTYADPRIVELINTAFVPVYVDTDERPDINDRYNQGGWPSIAVLTPDGRVLAGRTTMSADELIALLETVNRTYREDRETVYKKLESRQASLEESRKELDKQKKTQPLNVEMAYKVLRPVNLFVDPKYGGYGGPQKFPMPEVTQFSLYLYPKLKGFKEDSPAKAIELTLDGMSKGLFDSVEGGFFRYSTTIDWKNPHYEKLLATNGDLLGIYMRAYRLMGARKYLKVGEATAGYMQGTLFDDAQGAFYASQAADEKYYKLGPADRAGMGAPAVDGAIYADANGRAALGFLEAYRATGNERYMAVALRVVEHIMARHYVPGSGVRHSAGSGNGYFLSDQVYSALASLGAYQATGNHRYRDFAADVVGIMAERFWDPEEMGFFDAYYPGEPVGLLAKRNKPQIENSKAAILMMELYHMTGNEAYRDTARRALAPFTAEYLKYSFWAAPFALAVERVLETAYEFTVIGSIFEDGTMDLVTRSFLYDDPDRVVVVLDPVRDKDRIAKLGYRYTGTPVLYVCSEKACFPPVKPGESLDKTREFIEKARAQ